MSFSVIFLYNKFLLIYIYISDLYYRYYFFNYKNYNLLNYINEFSADLFDWYKIYELNIPQETKKACFHIHNIDYNNFKEIYIRRLMIEKKDIEKKINLASKK